HWGAGEIGGPRYEYRESLLIGMLKRAIGEGSRVLEAGCGSGSLLFKISGLGCNTFGIEQSKEYVEILRKRTKNFTQSNIKGIKQGSVVDIPFPDRSFEAVVSSEVLEHVRDDTAAILEFYRVLRAGGICVVSVPASPILWDFTDDWAGHLRRYTRNDIINLFEKKGFVVENVKFWGFPFVRLYHRFIYLPHLKKMTSDMESVDAISPPDAGKYQLLTKALSMVFRFDSLFGWAPFGIGLILKARKPGTIIDLKMPMKLGTIGATS
ncbi:MAG: class I SAM-dependent methyltransferase, partial [Nitrospira sp.]|nr:class I SAM-dependent methyltransferase [Nitrospira sp.]